MHFHTRSEGFLSLTCNPYNAFFTQFSSNMPKLLFVGIVERVCRATVIREIPGILECFQSRDKNRKGEDEIKVSMTLIQ